MPEAGVVIPTRGLNPGWLAVAVQSVRRNGVEPLVLLDLSSPLDARQYRCTRTSTRGLSAVLNEGLAALMKECEFVTWLGDDDALAPGSLDRSARALTAAPDAPFSYGWCRILREDGSTLKMAKPGRHAWRWLAYGTDFVPQPGSLLRTSALHDTGLLDTSLRYTMDLDLFLRLSRLGRPAYIARELAAWRVQAASLSSNKGDGGREADVVRQRYRSGAA
jgi:hypothetical protein